MGDIVLLLIAIFGFLLTITGLIRGKEGVQTTGQLISLVVIVVIFVKLMFH